MLLDLTYFTLVNLIFQLPLDDTKIVFEYIFAGCKESGSTTVFTNILQKLATIPPDQELGAGMWDLISKR
jgi:hypothetical protein